MCVILACEDKFPSKELLKNCEVANPHGGGIAWLDNKKQVHFRKGIDSKEINALIESGAVTLPCIVHFRIASVGKVTKELCHPFPISDKSELDLSMKLDKESDGVLFHNGTISNHGDIIKDVVMLSNKRMLRGEISDSRIMAFSVAQYGHEFIPSLDDSSWNKYAILDKEGITKYGNWHEDEGIQASNNYYKNQKKSAYYDNFEDDYIYNNYPIRGRETFTSEDATKELKDELNDSETFDYCDKDKHWVHKGNGVHVLEPKVKPKTKIHKILEDKALIDLVNSPNSESKTLRKGQRRKLRKFLKNKGWGKPEILTDSNLLKWSRIQHNNAECLNDYIDKSKQLKKLKGSKNFEYDDFLDEFDLQNQHWIEESERINSY